MAENNATDKQDGDSNIQIAVNSIQETAYVERIYGADWHHYNVVDHYPYDFDNLYPQKVISIKQRSWALSSATKTYSDFISGDGWSDQALNEAVLNSEGLTGYDLLRNISNEKAVLGIALHFNFDIQGRIVEINPIDFEDIRIRPDGKLIHNPDWSRRDVSYDTIYCRFNPDLVIQQIREVGIDNYTGQVLYWTGTNKIYPLATFDAALDSGQYQAESELFKLRNVQNDFAPSGLLRYPIMLDKSEDWKKAKENLKRKAIGANNAGRIILMGTTTDMDEKGKLFEPFEKNNADQLFVNQNSESKEIIFSVFRQPMILGAINPGGGWPNQQEMQDAFEYYNSIVEQDRKEVEKLMVKVFEASIWDFNEVLILPKMLIKAISGSGIPEGIAEDGISEADQLRLEAQAKLKGTVGGVDGILSIQEKVSQGITQYNAGLKILTEIYGFEEQVAREILGDEKSINKTTEEQE
jgi:hypothetical protein